MNNVVKTGGAVVVGGGILYAAYELFYFIAYKHYLSNIRKISTTDPRLTMTFEQYKIQSSKVTLGGG